MTMRNEYQRFPPRGGGPPARGNAPPYGGQSRPVPGLPEGYLKNGYFDEKGDLVDKVIIEWPKHIADALYSGRLAPTQLRNFFNEIRHMESQINAGQDFAAVRSKILQLDAYAANAVKRSNAPPIFKKFIEENIKWAAKDKNAFLKGFVTHFESVVAYYPKD